MSRHNSPPDDTPDPQAEIDLHGLPPLQALRRLAQELHACRLRRMDLVLVITGRGWGNRLQKPVLRPMVEEWLRGPEGRRFGVVGYEMTSQGGALLVELSTGGARASEERDRDDRW